MRRLSFRTRILFLVLAGAVVPLALLGLWLTGSAVRSGEALLRVRLQEALDGSVEAIGNRWIRYRSDLLFLAEDDALQRALDEARVVAGTDAAGKNVPARVQRLFNELDTAVESALVRDAADRVRWTLARASPAGSQASSAVSRSAIPALTVPLGIRDRASGRVLGTIEAGIRGDALFGGRSSTLAAAGAVIGIFDASTGAPLLPLPFDAALVAAPRFVWAGEEWITERRRLTEPPLELVAAAPISPFTQPFDDAARRGLWLLLAVAATTVALAAIVTGRMTGLLERLDAAAEAVSHGDLARRVEATGGDEVARLARSFNTMTESLQRTLRELSNRQALAAVGEFAATLAHEVRNPLTSIRVDLQLVEERLSDEPELQQLQRGVLDELDRLDRTVTGALSVARSGRIERDRVDLLVPLRSAIHAATPAFAERDASLDAIPAAAAPIHVRGDAAALEQLFLNLLLNAAQAVSDGGCAEVAVRTDAEAVTVSIRDDGPGIPAEVREHVFEPFFSTRPQGTGLGLAIAHRIATAHDAEIDIDTAPDAGTTMHVRLPLA